ncbi:8-oxo-dGTP diphosphatase MutT [Oceanobacter sp. 3_MG-2023]|jgi:8-oxo-dGTP diphosphatase|uniref:8-oxo-dGTP diphosphatase MutT n=1 Tax=Oceanobacter sp. 3_MG-2023 TaxID=3062622 RepID=UPI0027360157|nr:8-oxo-dGTP diphosphatase MutT [Oceanobacter sp. 3_MG-2023]MDP2506313.1 8-oxo-dGTP diphosphatase MutT [Oceanobacter sp. 3_MG-2023]
MAIGADTQPLQLAVAVAVICNPQQQILIAKRPDNKHQGGYWEFPGGKIEAGETTTAALIRELDEELGLQLEPACLSALIEVCFDYPDKSVRLDVYWVAVTAAEALQAHGAEGQPITWVTARELLDYNFPAANQPILEATLHRLAQSNLAE